MEGDILDNDDNKEDDNDNNDNDDNHYGMEYNTTVYDGRENTVAAVHQARLLASPSSANVGASIAPFQNDRHHCRRQRHLLYCHHCQECHLPMLAEIERNDLEDYSG